ncbi:hypothetical protein Bbelb_403650 [Branchiostoma belcheri]|nr:hypothetical protein Bbelb_403650 [Branchiostoma belcheri]
MKMTVIESSAHTIWLQVFATVNGTGQRALDAWSAGPGASVLHDKSPLVKIVLEASTGDVVLIFSGENTDKFSWFSQSRLVSSPWNDIKTERKNFFGVTGDPMLDRTFFINRNYGGCHNDAGWLVLAEGRHCPWERPPDNQRPNILFSLSPTSSNWNDACPSGYAYHQTSRLCYKAFNQDSDYTSAVAVCSSDGGTLAMPRDAATNTFLINLKNAVDNSAFFRFGLTDIYQEGHWVWKDGAALGHFRWWYPGQPDNHEGNEDCAEYLPGNHETVAIRNKWNDGSCSNHSSRKFAFICQVAPT